MRLGDLDLSQNEFQIVLNKRNHDYSPSI
jgi:hypothetical protein